MMDKDTGRPRGFGFVTFENEAGVEACINTPLEIHGKPIEVKKAQPRGNMREEEEAAAARRNKFRKEDGQGGAGMGAAAGAGGMSPQVMAQYMQRMQQYFQAMQQQQMAMNRGMGGMNPMMQQMMMAQMQQQMMGRGGGGGAAAQGGANPMMGMNPQMMQQMMAAQCLSGMDTRAATRWANEIVHGEKSEARDDEKIGGRGRARRPNPRRRARTAGPSRSVKRAR